MNGINEESCSSCDLSLPAVAFVVVEEEETIGHGSPSRDCGCAERWRDGCVVDEIEPAVTRCGAEEEEHCIHERAVFR